MKKRTVAMIMAVVLGAVLIIGCGSAASAETVQGTEDAKQETAAQVDEDNGTETAQETTITVFAAKSLNTVMDELIEKFNETHPEVTVAGSYDSSGTLMNQIREGAACDIFFSAAQTQMNTLEEEGFLVEGTRHNVVNNQVCVVTYQGSNTSVTGLSDLDKADSLALADGSVPVGKYTRQALVNAGILEQTEDVASISTQTVSEALNGITINECANVGAVTAAVAEASNEVGTIYYSDTYGFEDKLEILEVVPYELTGNVIYPVARTINREADEAENAAADAFVDFLISADAKEIFASYYFDTDVED